MELEDIPLEQFTDFCESLDSRELSRLAQTSKENYQLCKDILVKRKTSRYSELSVSEEDYKSAARRGVLRPKEEIWINDRNVKILCFYFSRN